MRTTPPDRAAQARRPDRPGAGPATLAVLSLLAATAAAAAAATPADPPADSPIVITPLTDVVEHPRSGYFSDPYPIPILTQTAPPPFQLFSGTTASILVCPAHPSADCIDPDTLTLDPGPLAAQAKAAGVTLGGHFNHNIILDRNGAYQMAATYDVVENPHAPQGAWTVIVHAHPARPNDALAWVADTLLVGSLHKFAKANYDGKYVLDGKTLYLVYSRNLTGDQSPGDQSPGAKAPGDRTPVHDGIVAQRMTSPTALAATGPVTLLEPEPGPGLNSELFFDHGTARFKLVETGNITEIDGKYAMAYSTGDFQEPDYKTGIAWSDTFLPAPNTFYRKLFRPDPTGIWGSPGPEVQYLLQSEQPAWPNDVAAEVVSPGVPSIVQAADGSWRLYFAGFAPGDHPLEKNDPYDFKPDHRRPFVTPLRVNIPPNATVARATDAQLATWIEPVTAP